MTQDQGSPGTVVMYWVLLTAACLHVIEEYSTGFLEWFRRAIPALAPAMTWRWALAINAGFLGLCLVGAVWDKAPTTVRMVVPCLLLLNALLHAGMTIRLRTWSPGLATAMLLYVPLGAWALWQDAARLSGGEAIRAILGAATLSAAVHALAPLSLVVLSKLDQRRRRRLASAVSNTAAKAVSGAGTTNSPS